MGRTHIYSGPGKQVEFEGLASGDGEGVDVHSCALDGACNVAHGGDSPCAGAAAWSSRNGNHHSTDN